MPSFLIVSATKLEILPLLERFRIEVKSEEGVFSAGTFPEVSVLVTGVGMVNTAFWMGKISEREYDVVINAGICGAFNRALKIGEVVNIAEDVISELGAQNDNEFLKYQDLKLGGKNVYVNKGNVSGEIRALNKVRAITVNTVHGNEKAIESSVKLYAPDVESMEGAAFFRGCEGVHKSYFQVRAVSNYVEKRDKSKWDIPLAIRNLNKLLINFIESSQ